MRCMRGGALSTLPDKYRDRRAYLYTSLQGAKWLSRAFEASAMLTCSIAFGQLLPVLTGSGNMLYQLKNIILTHDMRMCLKRLAAL